MNLEQLPSGKWRAVVSVAGTRHRSHAYRTKGEARHAGAELLIRLGGDRPAEAVTVAELIEGHLAEHADRWSPTTYTDMRRVAARLPDPFLDRTVQSVTPAVVDVLYRQLARDGWSPHRIRRLHTLLGTAWKRAVLFEWTTSSPVRLVSPPPAATPDIAPPDVDHVARLLAAADDELRLFVRLAATTGARRGELTGLRWEDVDLDAATVRIRRSIVTVPGAAQVERPTKTGSKGHRTVSIDLPTVAALRRHLNGQRAQALAGGLPAPVWVFSGDGGSTPHRTDHWSRRFLRLRRHCGVPETVRLHDLRHFVATQLLNDGEAPATVAGMLGHSTVATTLRVYAHFIPGSDREAVTRLGQRLGG